MAKIDIPVEGKEKVEKDPGAEIVIPLRTDLKLQRAPDESDGTQMYTLYDSVAGKFYKISWVEATIIQEIRPGMTINELIQNINSKSTAQVSREDVQDFLGEASQLDLLSRTRTGEELLKGSKSQKTNPFYWLLLHYLYVRIPLVNPDKFLDRTLRYVKPLFSRKAIFLYGFVIITGMMQLFMQFDTYIHTFTYFFNIQGIFVYALAISLVKIIHEFSHAYTAKNYGVDVPTMGVALIVLWPVLYTDVTDGWKLQNRFQRLAISGAGVIAELILAGFATWGWILSPPGMLQSVFFLISSTTWISSVLLNSNPLMRFDGYYILSDLWGIDNLQNRAFALTRWQLRKTFLGLNIPPPEEFSKERQTALIVYSVLTMLYRISLYLFVAVFVYLHFTKLLGIILFLVEIGVFLVWPLVEEIVQVVKMRAELSINSRLLGSALALSLLVMYVIVPLPHGQYFTSITIPYSAQLVYAPQAAIVKDVYVKRGDHVEVGQPLLQLDSKLLESDIARYQSEADLYRRELLIDSLYINGLNKEYKGEISQNRARLASSKAQLSELLMLQKDLLLKAEVSGTVYYLMEPLEVGQALKQDDVVAKIANLHDLQLICFVPEDEIANIKVSDKVTFRLETNFESITGKVIKISPYKEEILQFEQLSSLHRGNLPVAVDSKGKAHLVESYYTILIKLDDHSTPLNIGQTGFIRFQGPWQSYLSYFTNILLEQFWKQSAL